MLLVVVILQKSHPPIIGEVSMNVLFLKYSQEVAFELEKFDIIKLFCVKMLIAMTTF